MHLIAVTLLVLGSLVLAQRARTRNDPRLAKLALALSVGAVAVGVWTVVRMIGEHRG